MKHQVNYPMLTNCSTYCVTSCSTIKINIINCILFFNILIINLVSSFRFACLQYLVAMTVIVTPCLLLIGSDINDKKNLSDENLEWSLEDEYEYRRRRFYYRCAGISSCYVDGNFSTSVDDDEDDEGYKLTANSDFDSGYSLPPREEWAAEKRHWFDLLTRHRAAALDKWIRTAADAKQAVGDVYGYRALMSALCSDRVIIKHFE